MEVFEVPELWESLSHIARDDALAFHYLRVCSVTVYPVTDPVSEIHPYITTICQKWRLAR